MLMFNKYLTETLRTQRTIILCDPRVVSNDFFNLRFNRENKKYEQHEKQ